MENRQINGWEVDIYLPEYYFVIELDGYYHLSSRQQKSDQRKNQALTASGYHVLRFSNEEVYQDIEGCLKRVLKLIKGQKKILREVERVDLNGDSWRQDLKKLKLLLEKKGKKEKKNESAT